jgi:hypothetical protein
MKFPPLPIQRMNQPIMSNLTDFRKYRKKTFPGLLILTGFFLITSISPAQNTFPSPWLGNWKGELKIYNGKELTMTVPMSIEIQETDSSHRWQWTLTYYGDQEDRREYELVTVDREAGHYQIDEKNSIILDAYWKNHTLVSRFSVDNSLLLINYHFESEQIRFEVFSGGMKEATLTGEKIEGIEKIQSFPIGTIQQAVLLKDH